MRKFGYFTHLSATYTLLTCNVHLTHLQRAPHSPTTCTSLTCNVHLTYLQLTPYLSATYTLLTCNLHLTHLQHAPHLSATYTSLIRNLHLTYLQLTPYSPATCTSLIRNLHLTYLQHAPHSPATCTLLTCNIHLTYLQHTPHLPATCTSLTCNVHFCRGLYKGTLSTSSTCSLKSDQATIHFGEGPLLPSLVQQRGCGGRAQVERAIEEVQMGADGESACNISLVQDTEAQAAQALLNPFYRLEVGRSSLLLM